MLRPILRGQALYYLGTGLWPLVSLRTFELVTGPKTDDWLVRMVGLLAAAIGAALWAGARRSVVAGEIVLLAAGSAASFAAIDLTYVLAGRIPPIYLADAAVEVGLVAALAVAWFRAPRP